MKKLNQTIKYKIGVIAMKYIIGVDGGGTKTEAILFDKKGNEKKN